MRAMTNAMTQTTRTLDPALVSKAVVVWTGKGGRKPFTAGGGTRVVERFGAQAADELLPELRRLHDEFLGFPAPHGLTKWQAADAAAADFGARYASLSSAALEALRWCYAHEVANE